MSNKTANTNNTNSSNKSEVAEIETVEIPQSVENAGAAPTAAELVEAVKTKGALQSVKARSQRDWISIVGAGAIAAIGSAANMIVVNALTEEQGKDKPYSMLDIAGVSVVTGVVSSGVRAAVDFIPQVNQDDTVGLVTTSLVGNVGFVASSLLRDGALAMLRGQVSVNVEEMAADA
jgi:hypothetical protein